MDIEALINVARDDDVTAEFINELAAGQDIDNIGEHLKAYLQVVKCLELRESTRPKEVRTVICS